MSNPVVHLDLISLKSFSYSLSYSGDHLDVLCSVPALVVLLHPHLSFRNPELRPDMTLLCLPQSADEARVIQIGMNAVRSTSDSYDELTQGHDVCDQRAALCLSMGTYVTATVDKCQPMNWLKVVQSVADIGALKKEEVDLVMERCMQAIDAAREESLVREMA